MSSLKKISFSEIMRQLSEKKNIDTPEWMLSSHVLGLLKMLCIMSMCWLHLCQQQLWSSQGLPCQHTPYHSVWSSWAPVFTACCSVWHRSGYRQSNYSFSITLHQHSTTCIYWQQNNVFQSSGKIRGRVREENVDA